jgi:putative copper resistance protein D
VRGLILLTLLALVGTVVAARLVERAGVDRLAPPRAAGVIAGWLQRLPGLLAWFLLILSLVRGLLQVLAFSDPGMPIDTELALAVLTVGPWGTGWMVQTAAAFILLALSWLARDSPVRLRRTVALMTGLLLVAQSGMGHGVEDFWSPALLGRAVHLTHLLGGGLWIGTLMILGLAVIPSLLDDDARASLGDVVRRFSVHARIGALLVVSSGVLATLVYTASLADLWTTPWGWLLLGKLAAFVAIAALGWINWRVITPRLLANEVPAVRQLRMAVALEATLALLVVGLTAVLVASELPGP